MTPEHVEHLLLQLIAQQHAVDEVGTIERTHFLERIAQPELRHDVAAHAAGRGRGEGMDAGLRQQRAHLAEPAVLRAEVVPPLADAVRLVDGDEAHAHLRQPAHEAVAAVADQALGRHVQQARVSLAHGAHDVALLVLVEGAVVAGGRHAVGVQAVHLVLHQRDERRNDHRQPRLEQRRRLEAERLAAARRHHEQRVAAGEDRVHDLALVRPELRVAPVPGEDVFEGGRKAAMVELTRRRSYQAGAWHRSWLTRPTVCGGGSSVGRARRTRDRTGRTVPPIQVPRRRGNRHG